MARILRQGETHDPQRVHGPAHTRNQVRSVALRVDEIAPGKLRLSSPYARGWTRVVTSQRELAVALAEAFTEVQIATYAAWRGEAYDRDVETPVWRDDPDPLVAAAPLVAPVRREGRSDIHDPRDWTPIGDKQWRSPGGRVFREDTAAVQRVLDKRRKLGLD